MRVLLGGVIGAAAAAAAWMAVEHCTKQEFGWMAIVVGLVTGLAVHCAAGSGSRSSYGRGALAAVLALTACVGCRLVYAKVMAKSDAGTSAVVAADAVEPSGAESAPVEPGEAETGEGESEPTPKPTKPVLSSQEKSVSGDMGLGNLSFQKGFSPWDMLWLSLAALVAYVVGKGRDRVAPSESTESAEGDPA